jgi:26S proteasome regulatory subunit N7
MRRKSYAQLLESYRSLSLEFLAEQFGVTTDFIDAYVSLYRTLNAGILGDLYPLKSSIVLLTG